MTTRSFCKFIYLAGCRKSASHASKLSHATPLARKAPGLPSSLGVSNRTARQADGKKILQHLLQVRKNLKLFLSEIKKHSVAFAPVVPTLQAHSHIIVHNPAWRRGSEGFLHVFVVSVSYLAEAKLIIRTSGAFAMQGPTGWS